MAGRLTDDGTTDTVIECDKCGAQMRYNFDLTSAEAFDAKSDGQDTYDAFVDECIEDFNDTHDCED